MTAPPPVRLQQARAAERRADRWTGPALVRNELGSPRRLAAASTNNNECRSRRQSLGVSKGLGGAATRQHYRSEIEPSASQTSP
ncbi:hypothetical protein E5288_WYG016184 [Bos mutus]|uniref:Uncharacterized protein n=1 Tax=Bos mutus TaxID=72004 RepID=A0A6B0RR85_9CETA|nr:hypothetical protein [Bos mutus]